MKSFVLGLVLAALPASCEVSEAQEVAPVTLYTQFDHTPDRTLVQFLRAEVKSIMRRAGFRFQWKALARHKQSDVSVELVVVTFKGYCDAAAQNPSRSNGPLGWTHTSDGEVLPFADVDCDRIRALVHKPLGSLRGEERSAALGRATGRVLAHELYHVIARTRQHGSNGVAKPYYSPNELMAKEFRFEEKEAKLLHDCPVRATLKQSLRSDRYEAGGGGR